MSVCIFGQEVSTNCLAVERLSAGPSQMQLLLEFCRICPLRERYKAGTVKTEETVETGGAPDSRRKRA